MAQRDERAVLGALAAVRWPVAAARVRTPSLFVHSDDAVLPDNVRAVAEQLGDLATVVWTEGEQTDFYDRPAQVDAAVAAAVERFDRMGARS